MSDASADDLRDVARGRARLLRQRLEADLAELRQCNRHDGADLIDAALRSLRALNKALESHGPPEANGGNQP